MKRLTYRDEEGEPHWRQELLDDDAGWAGELIRSTVADMEDSAEKPCLGRSEWEPCEHCKPAEYPPDYYGPHNFSIVDAEIYFYDTDDGWEGEEINFCPWCGRPLTDEAWDMLERRLAGREN